MSDDTPIYHHIQETLPLLDQDCHQMLRRLFTDKHRSICRLGAFPGVPGRCWMVETDKLDVLETFINDPVNQSYCTGRTTGTKLGYGLARKHAEKITLKIEGETIEFPDQAAVQEFMDKVSKTNEDLFMKVLDLESQIAGVKTAAVPSTAVPSTPLPMITGGRVSVSGGKRHYKNAQSKKEAVLERIAQMVAEHPEVYLGVDEKVEVRRRTAAMANAMGFTTSQGKPWNAENLANYAPELEKRIAEIIAERNAKFGKPRIRVSRAA